MGQTANWALRAQLLLPLQHTKSSNHTPVAVFKPTKWPPNGPQMAPKYSPIPPKYPQNLFFRIPNPQKFLTFEFGPTRRIRELDPLPYFQIRILTYFEVRIRKEVRVRVPGASKSRVSRPAPAGRSCSVRGSVAASPRPSSSLDRARSTSVTVKELPGRWQRGRRQMAATCSLKQKA